MKILVVDDEPLARDRLIRFLSDIDSVTGTATASSGTEALEKASATVFDIVLLDIKMPGMTGLDVAATLSLQPKPPAIIFCTAYDEFALNAFNVKAQAYLLKPIQRVQLTEALNKATSLNQAQLNALSDTSDVPSVVVQSGREKERITLTEIFYFRADQKYVSIYSERGERIFDESLKVLEDKFPDNLVRVHRNTLVSKNRITKLSRDLEGSFTVSLKGVDEALAVSRRHVKLLKQFIDQDD